MPRTTLRKGEPYFTTRGYPLSEEAKSKLLALLGYGDVDLGPSIEPKYVPGVGNVKLHSIASHATINHTDPGMPPTDIALIIGRIENALGIYVDGAQHIDNPPRAADYIREFASIEAEAWELSEKLFSINYYYSDELLTLGADCATVAGDLVNLAEAARKGREKFEGRSSVGARKNTALLETIRHLKRIFRDGYRGPVAEPEQSGAVVKPAEWEKRQHSFIRTALLYARAITRSYAEENLARLIRDSRTSLPDERNTVIERIASKRGGRGTAPYMVPEPAPLRVARGRRQKGSKR